MQSQNGKSLGCENVILFLNSKLPLLPCTSSTRNRNKVRWLVAALPRNLELYPLSNGSVNFCLKGLDFLEFPISLVPKLNIMGI